MFDRNRRLRMKENIRRMVRETSLRREDLIYPVFIVEGEGRKEEIPSLFGQYYYSVDRLEELVLEMREAGIGSLILFGLPDKKDGTGSEAYSDEGIVQRGLRKLREVAPDIYLITDVCLCQYTDHGHCGIIAGGEVDNDRTLEYLTKVAVSHGKAGADMVAPSDMMDGRIGAIRKGFDDEGMVNVGIMAYSAKYASAFYGPFREAANSAPQWGDRKSYQMDPGNSREALKEMSSDVREGADILMVKPALSYLDIIVKAREMFRQPMAAYSVSGEYAMIKSAAMAGLVDERKIVEETLLSMKRAGADLIITYYALEVGRWLKEEG